VSTEHNTAPVDTTAAQPAATELQPGQGVPADGVVAAEEAQPDAAALAAAAEAEARKAEDNRNRANRRFSDLTRERNAAMEEAAYWRGVAEAKANGQKQPQQQGQQPAAAQSAPGGAPDPSDTNRYPGGEFDPQYMRDLARFEARQELQAVEAERARRREFEAGMERYHAAIDAIDTEEFDGAPTGQAAEALAHIARKDRSLCDIITASRNAAWIAEHFARFPSDIPYALSLSPSDRGLLIGELSAKYGAYAAARPRQAPAQQQQAAPPPQASPASQFTPPPQVVGRGPSPTFNPETASYEEYAKARAEGRFQ